MEHPESKQLSNTAIRMRATTGHLVILMNSKIKSSSKEMRPVVPWLLEDPVSGVFGGIAIEVKGSLDGAGVMGNSPLSLVSSDSSESKEVRSTPK